jgi:hypothetical protein
LGFLGASPFRRKSPDLEHWISLEILGFSRPNRYFSMGYVGFSRADFFTRPLPTKQQERARGVEVMRKRRIVHGDDLTHISDCLQEIVVRAIPVRPASI